LKPNWFEQEPMEYESLSRILGMTKLKRLHHKELLFEKCISKVNLMNMSSIQKKQQ
jgi:hypothetical protein